MKKLRKIAIISTILLIIIIITSKVIAISDLANVASSYKSEGKLQEFIIIYLICLVSYVYMYFFGWRKLATLKYGGTVKENKVDYCRELPKWLDMDFELAYASLYHYSNIPTTKLKNGLLGAILLKWSNSGYISIEDKGNRVFSIDLKDGNFRKTELEERLYKMLKQAAGDNNIIESNELRIWARKNSSMLQQWYSNVLKYPTSENLRPEAEALIGLKKFLQDYSLIEERKHIEVTIWEKYLIYAQLLGIAKEVSKEFKDIHPNYSELGQLKDMSVLDAMEHLVALYINIKFFLFIPLGLAIVLSMFLIG